MIRQAKKTAVMGKKQGDSGGAQRAAEINDAMLNIPGYADDSLLFVVRYGSLAKDTLRKVDCDEFLARLQVLNEYWFKSGMGGCGSRDTEQVEVHSSDQCAERVAELREHTIEKIREFPELMRDFDKFVACTRRAAARNQYQPGV